MLEQTILSGLIMGSIYALIATGFTLVFGVMGIANFAHGEFVIISMYICYALTTFLSLNSYFSLLAVLPAGLLIGIAIQRILIRPLLKSPHYMQMMVTLGVVFMVQGGALLLFSSDLHGVPIALPGRLKISSSLLPFSRIVAAISAIFVIASLYTFLYRTDQGKAIRACSDNREGAQLLGIDVDKVHMMAFGIGIICCGVAGVVILPFWFVSPFLGLGFTLKSFSIAVIAGVGSIFGTLIVGLGIGIIEQILSVFVSPTVTEPAVNALLILVLLLYPLGLFSSKR